jgi:hypothetical protein
MIRVGKNSDPGSEMEKKFESGNRDKPLGSTTLLGNGILMF